MIFARLLSSFCLKRKKEVALDNEKRVFMSCHQNAGVNRSAKRVNGSFGNVIPEDTEQTEFSSEFLDFPFCCLNS
jgi:hypothetical protein